MKCHKNRLIHWIAAAAIAMSALAPAVSQAVSLAKHGQGFAMEICSVDGDKIQIQVQGDEQEVAEQGQPCPYCICLSGTKFTLSKSTEELNPKVNFSLLVPLLVVTIITPFTPCAPYKAAP